MIDLSNEERRRAFSVWLRTGRLPVVRTREGVELKFNPYHDPKDGRFTFSSAGQTAGHWRADTAESRSSRSKDRDAAKIAISAGRTPGHKQSGTGAWGGGGFTGGGGGDFGGAGASATWDYIKPQHRPSARPNASKASLPHQVNRLAPSAGTTHVDEPYRTVIRNGYTYQIDANQRTRQVSGALSVADTRMRSRKSQTQAGGADRRKSDDGGHYIAARFNGPTDAFNHFAQDAKFNRGTYRALENQWANAKHAGKHVTVTILPRFEGGSTRPSVLDVVFRINGHQESVKLTNGQLEKYRGK